MDNHQEEQEKVIEEDDQDGGWVDTHHFASQYSNLGFLNIVYLFPCLSEHMSLSLSVSERASECQ